MRISDWSSDVCSSDLTVRPQRLHDEGVGGAVAGPAQRLALKQAGTLEGEEQIARHMGDMGGEFGVGHCIGGVRHFSNSPTMSSAASSALIFVDRKSTRLNSSH